MGIGKITEARETAGGTVQAGGRTVQPKDAAAGFDPLKANVDPFKERERQIESLRPIADAIGRQELATTGIEKASATRADIDEIRNGNPNGDGNGGHVGMWRDKGGVWRKALNSDQLSADERAMVTRLAREELRHRRDERLRGETNDVRAFVNRETGEDIAAFEGDCDEALLVGRIGENFGRAEAAVAGDAGAMTNTALGRIGSDNALLKTFNAASGGEFDAGAAARQRTDLWARQYVRQSLEGRMKAAVVLASQSGGLMSPAAAMKRANEIYDRQASELVRQLVEAGEYERARMFVGHAEELGYSGAVKAKALGEIDAAEDVANKKAFNGVQSVAQSAVASGMLASVKDPQTGALQPGMEDAILDIRDAKAAYAPGTELRAAYDRLEAEVTGAAEKAQASQYLAELANAGRTDVEPTDEIKAEPWKLRAFEAAKGKYLKAVEQQGKDLRAARDLIWKENADSLKRLEAAYFQARAREGGWNSRATDLAYANLKRTWNQIGLGGVSGEFAKTFLGDLKDIGNEEIVEGMTEFWRMLKGVKVIGPKDSRSREASSGGPELDKYGSLTDATVRHMDLGEEVGFDTGDEGQPFTMTVDEALVFSEQVRYELHRMDVKDRRKSEVVRDVVKKVYVNAAKAMADGKIRDGEKGQALAREFGEQMTNLKMKLEEPSLKSALDERERQDEVQKPLRRTK